MFGMRLSVLFYTIQKHRKLRARYPLLKDSGFELGPPRSETRFTCEYMGPNYTLLWTQLRHGLEALRSINKL